MAIVASASTEVFVTAFALSVQTIALANTEQSFTFPTNTKRFIIKIRSGGPVKFAFTAATSGTTYIQFLPGDFWSEGGLGMTTLTLYFQSATAGTIIEFESAS